MLNKNLNVFRSAFGQDRLAEIDWSYIKQKLANSNAENDLKSFIDAQWKKYPWLPQGLVLRYCKSYGRNMDLFLDQATSLKDLGQDLGHHVFEKEIEYLVEHEWAKELDDIIWRRSKLGLLKDKKMEDNIRSYLLKKSS